MKNEVDPIHLIKQKHKIYKENKEKKMAMGVRHADLSSAVRPSLKRRVIAGIYDLVLLFSVLFVVTLIASIITRSIAGEEAMNNLPYTIWFKVLLFMIVFAFFVFFWVYAGQTLGMISWRLQLFRNDGYPLTFKDASLRFFLIIFTFWTGGFLWIFLTENKKALHDILSKTNIIVPSRRIFTDSKRKYSRQPRRHHH